MSHNTLTRLAAIAIFAGSAGAHAATVDVPQGSWGDMLAASYGTTLSYLFNVPAVSPLSISAQFVATGTGPTRDSEGLFGQAGYISVVTTCPGCGTDGAIIFDMHKSMWNPLTTRYTSVAIAGPYFQDAPWWTADENMGPYTPGAAYNITMNWNRSNDTIDITVGSYSRTVSSTGRDIVGLKFAGPSLAGSSTFGNLVVNTAPIPEPETWLMLAVGLGTVGLLRRRRQPEA